MGKALPWGGGLGSGGATSMVTGGTQLLGWGSRGSREDWGWAVFCAGSKVCREPGAVLLSLWEQLRA